MSKAIRSLYELKTFKAAIYVPLFVAVTAIIIIENSLNLKLQWDFQGIKNAWDFFHIPLTILSLVIPLVALIASNHRSVQSKEQIETAKKQNKLSVQPVISGVIDKDNEYSFKIKNSGLGPARITSFTCYYFEKEECFISFVNLLLHKGKGQYNLQSKKEILEGSYIAKDETVDVFKYVKNENPSLEDIMTWEALPIVLNQHCKIIIKYESLYEEKFEYAEVFTS